MKENKITQEIKYNPSNERLKREYFEWKKGANRKSEKTVDMSRRAIKVYEDFHELKNLEKSANPKQIVSFKDYLKKQNKSASTLLNLTKSIRAFYEWLSKQNGYKSKINLNDLEYFNLSNHEMMQAKKLTYKPFPTIEQLKKVVESMPYSNELEMRDRALICFIILSGMRVEAITSLQLKHIDINKELITQDGSGGQNQVWQDHSHLLFPC